MAEIIKRIGPASYWCRRCAHCNSVELGCMDDVPIYTCGDPYDGVEKKIPGNENITCTMFELANEVPIYELKKVKPIEEELKELKSKIKDLTDTNIKLMERNVELVAQCDETYDECRILKDKIEELESECGRLTHENDILSSSNKGLMKSLHDLRVDVGQRKTAIDNQFWMIQDLKKERDELSEKLKKTDISKVPKLEAQIKNLKYLNEESYKREEELENKLKRVESHDKALTKYFQNDEALINNIQNVIFPQEGGSDYTYSYEEILNKVKDLKVQSDENGTMYEDLKYWKERCHNAEADVTTLNSEVHTLNNMYNQLKEKNDKDVMHSLHLSYELNKMKSRYETECKSGSNIIEENVRLEKELEVALNKNTSLLTKVAERNRDIEKLRYENETKKKEYRDTINALKSQKKNLEERMEIMKDDIKYLKQRYEEE